MEETHEHDDHHPAHGVPDDTADSYRRLRAAIPEVLGAYAGLHRSAMADGALPRKVKELVALAIAVTRQCDGCIDAHARGAARHGATRQEVAEMVGVTVLMNGGPATVYGPRALAAYERSAATRGPRE